MAPTLIDLANSAGDRWSAWMIAASIDSAILLALVGLAWLAIRRRVAPQVGCGMFLLVPLKLLLPFAVTVPAAWAMCNPSGLVLSRIQEVSPGIGMRLEGEIPKASPAAGAGTIMAGSAHGAPSPARAEATKSTPTHASATVATVAPGPDLMAPGLTPSAIIMLAWLGVVALLLGRAALTHLRTRSGLRHAVPVDSADLGIDPGELCRIAGVSETTPFAEHAGIAAPAVWGVIRPTILVPEGIAEALTPEQLRWALLHELAHVRRNDLAVVALQRLAAILHFFNPVVWIANRVVHRLREYACDDLALSLGRASAVESGEAFLRLLRHAGDGGRAHAGALGIFGLDSRAGCLRRIHRLLDEGRTIRTAPGIGSLCGLALLAAVALPNLRASGEAPKADPKRETAVSPAGDAKAFELKVVGPDGKPVPGAEVEFRSDPQPQASQLRRGTFARKANYGTVVKADADGRIAYEISRPMTHLNFMIITPGYGPYWADWSSREHPEQIPTRFTAELDPAWSVGGVIVDPEGKPVRGVTVHPSIEFKKRPGYSRQFAIGNQMKTDASGKWHFDSVPAAMGEVHVEIDHPDYRPLRRSLARGGFGVDRGKEPMAKIALDRGLTVAGKVADESGKPISGAHVRVKFINDTREARTGADGTYTIRGCEERPTQIVASAKGRAIDMKSLNIEPGMGPVDFALKPGGTVRIRVLGRDGKPVPKARIFFQRWRGDHAYFAFEPVNQYADKDGVWVWDGAPHDEFTADICPPDGMQMTAQRLIARAEEYVFRTSPELVISGRVIDAETKQPIPSFRVTPGGRWNPDRMHWDDRGSFKAADGHFQLRQGRGELAHLVRVEAAGYRAVVSRDIRSDEGDVTLEFALERGKGLFAKIVTPRNLPASGAKVAIGVAGSQISIKNGDFDPQTYAPRETADGSGRFEFPAQDKDFQLVVVHPSGYAHIKSPPDWDTARIIRLEPWARVEGTYRIGSKPGANLPLAIHTDGLHSYGPNTANIFTQHETTTGPDGKYAFERVIPGKGSIGRNITFMVDTGATEVTSSCRLSTDFPGGRTTRIDLGGSGRAVAGKLLPREGFVGKVRWNFATVSATPRRDADGAPPDGPYILATVDRDGAFRIDDVPPGQYVMSVRFDRDDANAGRLINHPLEVPEGERNESAPIDLGTLKLEK